MTRKPFYRALALVLCCQPVFWIPGAVVAQTFDDPRSRLDQEPAAPTYAPSPEPGLFDNEGPRAPSAEPTAPPGTPRTPEALRAGELPPVDAPVDPSTYVCGPGDILELNFWGLQNFKLRVTIDLEGRAFIPKIGFLKVAGKTLADVRQSMRESVGRYFPRLGFDMALAEPRTFIVQLVDDVIRPGSKVARAVDRVATVIAREGGLGPKASTRRIEIHRRDGTVLKVDLLLFSITGDVRHNPYLQDGDVVRAPFEELAVAVSGAVNRPGRYELTGSRDLAEIVELAGGLSPSATRELPVSLVRRLPDDSMDQRLLPFDQGVVLPTLQLAREDAVRIPEIAELQRSVVVVGALSGVPAPLAASGVKLDEASSTRRFPFIEGDTVRTLLARVNGVGPLADLERAYVIRDGKSIPVNLFAMVMLRDMSADLSLELGDTLVIPFKQRNIVVQGAVFTPGSFPYNPSFRVEEYLALAGGRNRFALGLKSTRIITPDGATHAYGADLKIEPGSSVVVPERNYSRQEVVQIVLGVASVVISGVAVILAAKK